jgi:hypothetical protein
VAVAVAAVVVVVEVAALGEAAATVRAPATASGLRDLVTRHRKPSIAGRLGRESLGSSLSRPAIEGF